jgi:uncharacterized membrane protein
MDPTNPNFQGPPNNGGRFFNGPLGPGGGPMMRHVALGPGFWIGQIVMLVVVLLVLALLLFLLYRALRPSGRWGANAAALRELEMRYARGEIGRDEFLLRRHDLTSPVSHVGPPTPPASAPPPPAPPAQGAQAPT